MSGRVAFVTGGARGIGRAIALRLAADGRRVAVADMAEEGAKETVGLIESAGGAGIAVYVDVTDTAAVEQAVARTAAELGPVEILVNNAGWEELHPFTQTEEAFWEKIVQINYLGVLRTVKACLPTMTEAGWGRIVNIASDAGRVGSSMEGAYSGAKGGVIAFTKTIAREAARGGVTANAVCPGPTLTPLMEEGLKNDPKLPKFVEAMKRSIPLGRLADPDDIATAVGFFSSDAAGYVTGQTLSVSGGLTMS